MAIREEGFLLPVTVAKSEWAKPLEPGTYTFDYNGQKWQFTVPNEGWK